MGWMWGPRSSRGHGDRLAAGLHGLSLGQRLPKVDRGAPLPGERKVAQFGGRPHEPVEHQIVVGGSRHRNDQPPSRMILYDAPAGRDYHTEVPEMGNYAGSLRVLNAYRHRLVTLSARSSWYPSAHRHGLGARSEDERQGPPRRGSVVRMDAGLEIDPASAVGRQPLHPVDDLSAVVGPEDDVSRLASHAPVVQHQ